MRETRTRYLLLAALLLMPVGFVATSAVGDDTDAESEEKELHPLHEAMEALDEAFKAIRKTIRHEDKNAETIELVRECQKQVMIAKVVLPKTIDRAALDKQESLKTDYAVRMAKLMGSFCTLEVDLLEKRQKDAQATYKELIKMRFEGHLRHKDQ